MSASLCVVGQRSHDKLAESAEQAGFLLPKSAWKGRRGDPTSTQVTGSRRRTPKVTLRKLARLSHTRTFVSMQRRQRKKEGRTTWQNSRSIATPRLAKAGNGVADTCVRIPSELNLFVKIKYVDGNSVRRLATYEQFCWHHCVTCSCLCHRHCRRCLKFPLTHFGGSPIRQLSRQLNGRSAHIPCATTACGS